MNCEECKEQVFELIEREAVDPEGVREVLARCPECRALFDQMKAALANVDRLPIEEPPAELDAAILRAARGRSPKVVRLRRRGFRAPQWAVAAVAVLAVGVGVWAIPRGEPAGHVTEVAAVDKAEVVEAEEPSEEAAQVVAVPSEEIPMAETAKAVQQQRPVAKERLASKSTAAPAAKRKSAADTDMRDAPADAEAARIASAPAEPSARLGGAANMDMAAAEAPEREAKKESQALSRECSKRLAKLERRGEDDEAAKLDPEDALAIGRCYQAAGDSENARAWLERAAKDPRTEERARQALKEMGDD